MIITLKEVKEFLKIDYDDEDSLLQNLIQASESYLFNATGKSYSNNNELAKLYCMVLVNDWHKDRNLLIDNGVSNKVRFTLQSILLQLKFCEDKQNGKM